MRRTDSERTIVAYFMTFFVKTVYSSTYFDRLVKCIQGAVVKIKAVTYQFGQIVQATGYHNIAWVKLPNRL